MSSLARWRRRKSEVLGDRQRVARAEVEMHEAQTGVVGERESVLVREVDDGAGARSASPWVDEWQAPAERTSECRAGDGTPEEQADVYMRDTAQFWNDADFAAMLRLAGAFDNAGLCHEGEVVLVGGVNEVCLAKEPFERAL